MVTGEWLLANSPVENARLLTKTVARRRRLPYFSERWSTTDLRFSIATGNSV